MAKAKKASKPRKEKVKLPENVAVSVNNTILTEGKQKQGVVHISKTAAKKINQTGNLSGLRITLVPKKK